ncbi:hypothetical protein ABIC02_007970 [Bradyrhizobium sp. RT5a]
MQRLRHSRSKHDFNRAFVGSTSWLIVSLAPCCKFCRSEVQNKEAQVPRNVALPICGKKTFT